MARQYLRNAFQIPVFSILFLGLFLSCSDPQLAARRELSELNIEFTTARFIQSIKDGDFVVVRLFLEAGKDPNALQYKSRGTIVRGTPLLNAMNQPKIVKLLLEYGANLHKFSLINMARKGSPESIQLLIQAGADVNHLDDDGNTALMWAVYAGEDIESVRLLLAAGADPKARTKKGETLLEKAHQTYPTNSPRRLWKRDRTIISIIEKAIADNE